MLPATPKSIQFDTEPLRKFAQKKAEAAGLTVAEFLNDSPVRRTLHRARVGIVAVDTFCAALGAHPSEVFGQDFYRGLEGVPG